MVYKYDFLIIGSGVAGMSYALQVANSGKGKVALLCKKQAVAVAPGHHVHHGLLF